METTTHNQTTVKKQERRNEAIPPYFILRDNGRFLIEEDLKPFIDRGECLKKLNELRDVNVFNTYKIHTHCGRYYIYKKNEIKN